MAVFTSWDDLITAIKNDIANHISEGGALIGEYSVGTMRVRYRTVDEAEKWLQFAYRLKTIEEGSTACNRKSFGRYRRFR